LCFGPATCTLNKARDGPLPLGLKSRKTPHPRKGVRQFQMLERFPAHVLLLASNFDPLNCCSPGRSR
jgi:hypothetical protein